jgi:hypothetical protein
VRSTIWALRMPKRFPSSCYQCSFHVFVFVLLQCAHMHSILIRLKIVPKERATAATMLQHPWISVESEDMEPIRARVVRGAKKDSRNAGSEMSREDDDAEDGDVSSNDGDVVAPAKIDVSATE